MPTVNSSAPSGCQLPTWPHPWDTTQPARWASVQHQPAQDDVKGIHMTRLPQSKFAKPGDFVSTNMAVDQDPDHQYYHHHPRPNHQISSAVGLYPQSRPGLRQPYRHHRPHQWRPWLPKKHQNDGNLHRQSPPAAQSTRKTDGQSRFPKTATIHVSPKSNSGECQVMFPWQPETVASNLLPENVKHVSTEPVQNEMPSVEWPASSRGKIVRLRGRPGAHVAANHGIPTEVEPMQLQKQQLPSIREALPGLFTKDV